MQFEKTLQQQTRRVDREKANKPVIVNRLPGKAIEGDIVHLGEPPASGHNLKGYYMRLNGEWRFMGGAAAVAPLPDEETPRAEILYSSELQSPFVSELGA